MVDPRLLEFLQALGPFTERMHWLLPESGRGQPVPLDRVRALLAEWEELERTHLPLPSAHLQTTIQPVLKMVQGWRVRIQAEFMFAVMEMLEAWVDYHMGEQLMKLPSLVRQAIAEGREDELREAMEICRKQPGEPLSVEDSFRQMMAVADEMEAIWQGKMKALKRTWPVHWTPLMQARLDAGHYGDLVGWHGQLFSEIDQLAQDFPGLVTPPPGME